MFIWLYVFLEDDNKFVLEKVNVNHIKEMRPMDELNHEAGTELFLTEEEFLVVRESIEKIESKINRMKALIVAN